MDKNSEWYRNQCSRYAERLNEWLTKHPGRVTKSRKTIIACKLHLSGKFRNDADAHEALMAVEEVAFCAPAAAKRVISKAIGR